MNRREPKSDSFLSREATWKDVEGEGAVLAEATKSLTTLLGTQVGHLVVGDTPGRYQARLPFGLIPEEFIQIVSRGEPQGPVSRVELEGVPHTAVPLEGVSGESFGWLIVDSTHLNSVGLRALLAAAREVGEAFEQAWLLRCANYDSLTRLPNRRFLERMLIQGFEAAQRNEEPYSVAFFDLDHFKAVNDTHGHDVGDAVLKEAAQRLSSALRDGDVLGRWGGEEFVIGLANVNAEEAKALSERVALALGVAPMEAGVWVTASVGIASGPAHGDSLAVLLREADAALYAAKDAGRDRVCISGRVPTEVEASEKATWLCCTDGGLSVSYPLMPGTRYLLGRSIHCDVRLEDPSVSRVHAAIRVDRDGRIAMTDQGSYNGVLRNGRLVTRGVELRVGDRIQVGRYEFDIEANGRSLTKSQITTACRQVSVSNLATNPLEKVLDSARRRGVTGKFDIASKSARGRITLEEGKVVRAEHGNLQGHEALTSLHQLREGVCILS